MTEADTIRAEKFPLGQAVSVTDLERSPHEVLRELRAHEPVSWLPVIGAWFVTTRELAVGVLRDPETFTVDDLRFSTARLLGPSMLSLDGEEHDRHRDPFTDAFRLDTVRRSFSDWSSREARRLVTGIRPAGTAELRRQLAGPLAVSVITRALGLRDVDPATILGWYSAIVSAVSQITVGEIPSTAGADAYAELKTAVTATVEGAPESLLAAVAEDGSLDEAELAANVGVLMFGAIETSEGMTANALFHLLGHPGQLESVRAHRDLIPDAVEESLRFEPAAAVVDRYATRDVELAGAPILRGDPVTVSLTGANRDPETFADPDRFDVRRENARMHVSFVHGPHACLGIHLARLETIAAIEAVIDLLPGIRLDESRSTPPTGLVFRKPAAVVATWRQPPTTA